MKHILLSAALVVTAAGAAVAMTQPTSFTGPDRAYAERLVPNANFDNLTTAQVNAIEGILYSGDSNRAGQIRAILN
ncbi:MAG: hypothetical protein B7Z02_15725 [Rhodobacterales bacterium 32-67-9]|nr:MAG: hypothetical protein B7Z02_15725 [Rhodobacterales bacterium 32-67-9]